MQSLLDKVCDRGFTRSRQAREPEDTWPLSDQRGARRFVDFKRPPMNVGRATQRILNYSAADDGECQPIDENETPGFPIFLVAVEREWSIERDIARSYLIEIQMLRREVFARADIYPIFQLGDLRADEACAREKKI